MSHCLDLTMAPEGKPVIILHYESPWEFWNDLEGDAYKAGKKQIEKDSCALMEKYTPGITAHIEVIDIAAP